jgi:TonB family protein
MDSLAFIIATCVKATVVLAITFLVGFTLRRAPASARYFVWICGLTALLAIPLLSLFLRPWNVPLRPAPVALPVAEAAGNLAAMPISIPGSNRPFRWLLPIWICGAAVVMLRIVAGHMRVRRSLLAAEKVNDPLLPAISAELGLRSPVELRRSRETDVPLSYGIRRPVILVPSESIEWTPERRRVVLLHELIHIKRIDALFCFLAQAACAAYWFHPLAWLALARFRREQEQSCDDAVIMAGTKQSAYAEHLVGLARALSAARPMFPAALSMAETCNLEQRVRALLDPRRKRGALNRRICLASSAAILAAVVPLAVVRGQNAKPVSSVSGTVYDASGAAIPNATVLFKNTDGSNREVIRTGAAGEYRLATLAAGKYNVEVKAPGFALYRKTGIVLNAGVPEQLDFKLDVGTISDSIDVVGKGPRPAPVTSEPPRRIRVGGNVQATKLVRMVKPVYPPDLQAAGIEGTVLLRAVISVQGKLLGLSVINTSVDPELAKAATDAVKQWEYTPTLLNGLPVEVATTISVNFRLEN